MELAKNIILLLVGVAVLLIGMDMMSTGLKKVAGSRVRKLFDSFKTNRLKGLGIGAGATAVIQSSAATSVMAIGFVNAGVMSVFQAVSVIMGAYIGTTVTGLLVSLSTFSGAAQVDITIFFMVFAFVGVVLTFIKDKLVHHIGEICAGLGLLFFGLFTLKGAFNSEQINAFSQSVFAAVSNPLLLLIIGAIFTIVVQSSSAATGIMIVMCSTGAVDVSSAIWVALGATVGTVITAIIATIGGKANAKRVGLICLIMRVVVALLVLAILWPLNSAFDILSKCGSLFPTDGLFIAVFMVVYNVVTMFILLPFIESFEKLGAKLIKDVEKDELNSYIHYIDERLLKTPDVALMQVKKEIIHMNELAFENYRRGFKAIISGDLTEEKEIEKCENGIDFLNEKITDYLIKLSGQRDFEKQDIVGGYFHVINDTERIGDHASNFLTSAQKMKELGVKFSDVAVAELNEFDEILNLMFKLTIQVFNSNDVKLLSQIHQLEDKTDDLKDTISTSHFQRITEGKCVVELSPFLSTLVSELERVADHLTNIAYVQVDPTGKDDIN